MIARRALALAAALAATLGLGACAPLPPPGAVTQPPAAPGTPAAPSAHPERITREPVLDIALAVDRDTLLIAPRERMEATLQQAAGRGSASVVEKPFVVLTGHDPNAGEEVVDGHPAFRLLPGDTLRVGEPTDVRARLGWNGHTWRGGFKAFVSPRGKLTLCARVPLETYLLGVVPGEIGQLTPELIEAGKAQAIAARSFTLFYLGRRGREGFDLYGTVEDQVYGPLESERPLATRVVQETRGLTALSGGAPIRANYCSTCGGITAEVWEAWPEAPERYLVSLRDASSAGADWCASSPLHRWREEWTPEEFVSDIQRYGPPAGVPMPRDGIGALVDVRVASRSRSGRVWRLDVIGSAGSVRIPSWSLRGVLRRGGHPEMILRSNLFKIAVRRDPATRRALAVVASGAGSGHGVGLCQTGALGMARAGERSDAIVTHYYPGVELRRLY